ncbi:MAG: hypothetical protein R3300_04875, partial [Candidatus Promineifilaceae bacterium]|nr:hypothetical protein [Candidatus Promineifilaceae bacterium]
ALNEFALGGPGMPDDWPVLRSWQLMPADVAEVILNQSGPPDPTAPVTVAPFTIDLLVGDEAAYQRVYVPAASTDMLTLGGHEILVEREEPGVVRYVLSHPTDETVTLVVVDLVSAFPGREAQAEAVSDILATFLASFAFES